MKKAVIYARFSSDRQNENSISGQLTVCYQYAKSQDITVVGEYIDRALTGMNDDRPEFQRMLKDSAKKQWEYVIVYKLDRFARNRYDSAIHNRTLKNNNVKRLSATENISDSPEGALMESVLEGMSEYYSLELSQKINRGLNENIKKGLMVGGSVTYGYDMIDKKYFINEDAEHVRLIYSMYDDGKVIDDIIMELNRKGVYNVNGKPFSHQHISKILHNDRYIGTFTYKGEKFPNYIPPIIEEPLFVRIQERMRSYKNYGKQKSPVTFYLTGKLFCGHCGGNMNGIGGTSKNNKRHYYYTCKNKDKRAERKVDLEELVVSIVNQSILQSDDREEIIDLIVDSANKLELSVYNEIERIKRTIANNKKKINNLILAVRQGIISQSLQSDLSLLEEQNDRHKLEIAKLNSTKSINLDRDKVVFFFDKLTELSGKEKGIEFIIRHFVKRVVVWDDTLTIETHLNGDRIVRERVEYDAKSVPLQATHLHHIGRQKNTIGFFKPTIAVYRYSIFVSVQRKKES